MPRWVGIVVGAVAALGWTAATVGSARAAPTIAFEPAATTELTGADPRGAVAGDFDEDGHLDVAVTQWAGDSDDSVGILFGDGTGGFRDNGNFGGIPYSQGLGTADFDEDGHLDLVVTQGTQTKFASDPVCGATIGAIVAFGAGDGSFAPAVCLVGGSFPIDVAIADYDGDGHADVAVANNVSHGVTTFLGAGDGTFGAGVDVPAAYWTNYTDVVAADFDEDGVPDLAACHYNGAYVFRGNGDGTFAAVGGAGSSRLLEAVAAGDLNGDPHVDLAFTEICNDRLLLCPGNGDGTFGACETRTVGGFMREVGIADLNRDGFGDAAVSWQSGNQVRVFLGTGGGAFDAGTSFAVGLQPTPMVFVDLNEDGRLDVAEANRNLGDQAYLSVLIQVPQAPACTDLDGDGYAVEGGACGPADCDDADPLVNPGAAEVPGNGVDDDCDGAVDEAPGGCAPPSGGGITGTSILALYGLAASMLALTAWRRRALRGVGIAVAAALVATAAPPRPADAALSFYVDEGAYLAAVASLGATPVVESFEDDAAWGAVRSTIPGGNHTAPSVTNLGVTWRSRHATPEVSTGPGPALDGAWGFFTLPHGIYSADPACMTPGVCSDGWTMEAAEPLVAFGGWIDTNTGNAGLEVVLDDDPARATDFEGEPLPIGPAKFFGVIDPAGFSRIEWIETEGASDEAIYIFGDPFTFAHAPGACTDSDGDGYAVEGGACGPADCDDADPLVNPGAAEVPGNGVDDDCDGAVDEAPGGCSPVHAAAGGHGLWGAAASMGGAFGALLAIARRRRP